MLNEMMQSLQRIMRPEAFDEFLQNASVFIEPDVLRSALGLDDTEIKRLRAKKYSANASAAQMRWGETEEGSGVFRWVDEEENGDDEDGTFEDNDGHIRIFVNGPIDSWFGFDCIECVNKIRKVKAIKSIHMEIQSPGGFVSEGLTLYHEIKAQQRKGVPVTTEGRGLVASMGMDLFVSGDTRIVAPHSMMMIHAPWAWTFLMGNMWEMKAAYRDLMSTFRTYTQNAVDILSDNVEGLTKEQVIKWFKKGDKWMNENEAVELGFATEVASTKEDDEDDEDDDNKGGDDGKSVAARAEPTGATDVNGDENCTVVEPPEPPPVQQHNEEDETGQREPPAAPSNQQQEVDMLSDARKAQIRQALGLSDDAEVTEEHVEQYFAKRETDEANERMERQMQENARIRQTVEEGIGRHYKAGHMNKAQYDEWVTTVMRDDDPEAKLQSVLEQFKSNFGDPDGPSGAEDPESAAQQQQHQQVLGDPAAKQQQQQQKTKADEAFDRLKQLCEAGSNTEVAYNTAVRRVTEEFGIDVMRELWKRNDISVEGLVSDEGGSSFRTSMANATDVKGLVKEDTSRQVLSSQFS